MRCNVYQVNCCFDGPVFILPKFREFLCLITTLSTSQNALLWWLFGPVVTLRALTVFRLGKLRENRTSVRLEQTKTILKDGSIQWKIVHENLGPFCRN